MCFATGHLCVHRRRKRRVLQITQGPVLFYQRKYRKDTPQHALLLPPDRQLAYRRYMKRVWPLLSNYSLTSVSTRKTQKYGELTSPTAAMYYRNLPTPTVHLSVGKRVSTRSGRQSPHLPTLFSTDLKAPKLKGELGHCSRRRHAKHIDDLGRTALRTASLAQRHSGSVKEFGAHLHPMAW